MDDIEQIKKILFICKKTGQSLDFLINDILGINIIYICN